MKRRRSGFTLVNLVALIGTVALGLALVQTDVVTGCARRSHQAARRLSARALAQTALIAYPRTGPFVGPVGALDLSLGPVPDPSGQPPISGASSAPKTPSGPRAVARVRSVVRGVPLEMEARQ